MIIDLHEMINHNKILFVFERSWRIDRSIMAMVQIMVTNIKKYWQTFWLTFKNNAGVLLCRKDARIVLNLN